MATIIGLDKLNDQLKNLKGIKTATALLAGAFTLQGYAQENSPVDTGANRDSAMSEITGDNEATMSFNMEYSYYLEVGTAKMQPKGYVRKAIDEHTDDVVKAVANQIEKEMRGAI